MTPSNPKACACAAATASSLPSVQTSDLPDPEHLELFLQPGVGHDGVPYAIRCQGERWLSVNGFNADSLGLPRLATAENLQVLWSASPALALRSYGTTQTLVFDIDAGSPYHPEQDGGLALGRLLDVCRVQGLWVDLLHSVIRSSFSGGLHVWFAFLEPLPAQHVAALGEAIAAAAGLKLADGHLEAYPERQSWEPGSRPPQRQAVRVPLQPGSGASPLRVIRCGDEAVFLPSGVSVRGWFAGLVAASGRHDLDPEALAEIGAAHRQGLWNGRNAQRAQERRQRRQDQTQALLATEAALEQGEPLPAAPGRHPGRIGPGSGFAGRTNVLLARHARALDPAGCRRDPHSAAELLRQEVMADPAYQPSPASRRDLEHGTWALRWVRWRARGGGGGGCRSRGPEPEGPVGLDNEGRRLDRQARQRIAQAVADVLAQQGVRFASEGSLRAFGKEIFGLHFKHTQALVLPPEISFHTRTNCVGGSLLRPRHLRDLVQILLICSSDSCADASPRWQQQHPLVVAVLALHHLGGLSLLEAVAALEALLVDLPEHLHLGGIRSLTLKALALDPTLQPEVPAERLTLATVTPISAAPGWRRRAPASVPSCRREASTRSVRTTGPPTPLRPAAGDPGRWSGAPPEPAPVGPRCLVAFAPRALAERAARRRPGSPGLLLQLPLPIWLPLARAA